MVDWVELVVAVNVCKLSGVAKEPVAERSDQLTEVTTIVGWCEVL